MGPAFQPPVLGEAMEWLTPRGRKQDRTVRQHMCHDYAGSCSPKSLARWARKRLRKIQERGPQVSGHLNVGTAAT